MGLRNKLAQYREYQAGVSQKDTYGSSPATENSHTDPIL